MPHNRGTNPYNARTLPPKCVINITFAQSNSCSHQPHSPGKWLKYTNNKSTRSLEQISL